MVFLTAFFLRKEPWKRHASLPLAFLPHIAPLCLLALIFIQLVDETLFRLGIRLDEDPILTLSWLIGLSCPVLSLIYWAAIRLRIPLVAPLASAAPGSALSIYPDAATYVDAGGYAAQLQNLIQSSDGGVIGVTGVRGAGKSALLGYVLSQFERQHGVLWMTAPVSHERGMAFLTSICRAVCGKVLGAAEPILYGRTTERGRAFAEFLRRGSGVLTVLIALATVMLATWSNPLQNLASRSKVDPFETSVTLRSTSALQFAAPALQFPEKVRLHGFEGYRRTLPLFGGEQAYAVVINAEREVIRTLLTQAEPIIASLLVPTNDEGHTKRPEYFLLPVPGGVGFNLIFFNSENRSSIFQNPSPWEFSQVYAAEQADDVNSLIRNTYYYSQFDKGRSPQRDPYIHFYTFDNRDELNRKDLTDAILFAHYTVGDPIAESILGVRTEGSRLASGAMIDFFNGLEMVRGYPTIEPQMRVYTALMRDLLNSDVSAGAPTNQRPVELASTLLLNAFFEDPEGMVFDAAQLQQLVNILTPYLATLDGEIARPAIVASALIEPAAGPEFLTSGQASFWQDIDLVDSLPYLGMVAIFILLFFGEQIWRRLNFMLRGMLNFRLLTIVRDSEDFLQYLDYSEGREASAGLSLKGLTLGGKRTFTARALTLQGLTDRYLGYVRDVRTHYNQKIIIAIDELDKITDPREVRDILLEIKGALFQKGCFYLLSISEDAARAFRGRLSEGRDIFESSFDDVISIAQMDTESSAAMIQRRLQSSEDASQICQDVELLLTAFGGGIPREIVRNLRMITLDLGSGENVDQHSVAVSLFRKAVQDWIDHLPEIPLPGSAAILLRRKAFDVHDVLDNIADSSPWPPDIAQRLNECLAILDPEGARLTGKHQQDPANEDQEDIEDTGSDASLLEFNATLREVQYCLRLLIMDALLEKFWRDDPDWQMSVGATLACLRVLPDQPALAESMMQEMRGAGTKTALREQMWRTPKPKRPKTSDEAEITKPA